MSNTHTIHVMNDPESKIRFLETTLHGQDWRAKLLFAPGNDGVRHARAMADRLRERGYLVSLERDEHGHIVVDTHKTGHGTNWLDMFREYGMVKGATHTINNPMLPLNQLLDGLHLGAGSAIKNFSDPVRLGSLSYLTADTLLSFAGLGNKDAQQNATGFFGKLKEKAETLKNPKNWTQSLGGALFLVQSIIFMRYAKTGTELSVDEMNKAFTKAQKNGDDLNDVESWTRDIGKEKRYLAPKIIRDYPIQTGAAIQNTGMLLFLAHTFLEWKYKKGLLADGTKLSAEDFKFANRYVNKGGVLVDAYRGVASFIGWACLMYPVKKHEQKSDNPVERAFQDFEENPQKLSSMIATSTSLAGAASGTYFKGNMLQAAGELTYLPGDYLLSYANNSQYGKNDVANTGAIVEAVQKFITRSPMVLGHDARNNFACAIAEQLLNQAHHIELEKAKPEERDAIKGKFEENKALVVHELCNGNSLQDARYDRFIEASRQLIVRFPQAQRQAVTDELITHMTQIPSIYVTREEMQQDLALEKLPATTHHSQNIRDIGELSDSIRVLANVIPAANAGDVAATLYDALTNIIAKRNGAQPKIHAASVEHSAPALPKFAGITS